MRTSVAPFACGLVAVVLAAAAHGDEGDNARAAFSACVADLGDLAIDAGVDREVARESLRTVEFRERIIDSDRSQAEFVTAFGDYMERAVSRDRVERGRELLEEHDGLLQRIYRDYGVPPRYLVAFWGMETHYGSYFGSNRVLDALATLACDQRRSELFSRQLIAALQIIDEGAIEPRRMEGSWAGAMGHVQFMPSVFLDHAVDYDGDGRRDLWNSLADSLASAANYLDAIGWETGYRWGREVTLPSGFPYEHAGRDRERTLAEWQALGVRDAYGRAIGNADIEASLLVPSGHEGPAFLVYSNFDVIMRWNRSEFYALAVGRLADRLAGAAELRRQAPETPRLRREHIAAIQERLNEKGFDAGPVDGLLGPATRSAIRDYQLAEGMIADGFPSTAVLFKLTPHLAESRDSG